MSSGTSPILITGTAGFIGFHLAQKLCKAGHQVIGYDSVNDYYEVALKRDRLKILATLPNFTFVEANLEDKEAIENVFTTHKPGTVVNLAAQAGVRYSITNPDVYIQSNVVGFLNILEACRHHKVEHLVYASSSSVYGANKAMPFSVHQNVDHPLSLYAATKKSNELMAHTYSNLYGMRTTGLRFFTVYGPWGRPDMALFLFTKAILEGKPIDVFNFGKMRRDFTYIEDIVEGIHRLIGHPPKANPEWTGMSPDPGTSFVPWKVYNIGNHQPVELSYFIECIEEKLGRKAEKNLLPIQDGDVEATYANVDDLMNDVGFKPATPIETGISNFIDWYKEYYKIS